MGILGRRTGWIAGAALGVTCALSTALWAGGSGFGDDDHDHENEGPAYFGFVKDTNGATISDAKVTVAIKDRGGVITRTDALGRFRVADFPVDDGNEAEFEILAPTHGAVYETDVSTAYDGGNNVGMLALHHAAVAAIEKAERRGIALISVANAWTSGRSAYYVEMIARHDLVAVHTASSGPAVAPPGGTRAVLGTNPIALAIPTSGEPVVFDLIFTDQPVVDYRSLQRGDANLGRAFTTDLIKRGVVKNSQKMYISLVHSPDDVAKTLEACEAALKALPK